jgi:hypothetical protein
MSKTLICNLPENEVVETPMSQEMPCMPLTDEPEVPAPEQS